MDDLISRQAAIDALTTAVPTTLYDALRIVEGLPTIEPKKGKWIDVMTGEWCTFDECKCSVCGVVEYFNKGWKKFSYCPNCGARMTE